MAAGAGAAAAAGCAGRAVLSSSVSDWDFSPRENSFGRQNRKIGMAGKELLHDGKNPNARQSDGFTPLMIAAANGDTEIATMLLAKGADPNLRAGGRSALAIAKARGSAGAATVQLLERNGATQ